MSVLLEGDKQLEQELTPEPIAASTLGALLLHALLFGGVIAYGMVVGLFHPTSWGSEEIGGAIQATLVSRAALPLPADHPPNDNVLATEKPSEAPAAPAPKEQPAVDPSALAIASKQKPKEVKPEIKATPAPSKPLPHPPVTPPDNLARYGEQAGSNIARSTQAQKAASGPISVSDNDFGSRYSYYVKGLNNKMASSWYKAEVDARTPRGARVYLIFTIQRDGTPTNIQIDRSSGSPTLDVSCKRGAQRVDSFGPLPPSYNKNTLQVSYYCEY